MSNLLPSKCFLFDTNAWINAYNDWYAPDVFPGVWGKLENAVNGGIIVSPQEVIDEVRAKDDKVNEWVSARKKALVSPLVASNDAVAVDEILPKLKNKYPRLMKSIRRSKTDADYRLLAWGKVLNRPVVTMESQKENDKMPGVGRKEGVECITLLEFIRRQGWKF